MLRKLTPLAIAACLLSPAPALAQHDAGSKHMIEHMAALALVKDADVSDTAVQDGDWSDPATWGGTLPPAAARVLIPGGVTVTVDTELADTMRTIRVDGTLRFATAADTQLKVDTILVSEGGTLEMGTVANPVQAAATARLVIDNIDAFEVADAASPDYDPHKLGLGLIAHGSWIAHGRTKTGAATFTGAKAGDSTIQLDRLPDDWAIGDKIVIANCRRDAEGDEVRTIAGVDTTNDVLTLDAALAENHLTPSHHREGLVLRMHIINLTRNVIVETAPGNEDVLFGAEYSYRGHTMCMHSNSADLRYVQFRELGRTNKLVGKNDMQFAEFDEHGNLLSAADNPIARYPVHFHRAGTASSLAVVEGCAVVGSPGWAYVNHSSSAKINRNVSYDVDGAAFISEAGNEIGEFYENVSVRTHGRGHEPGSFGGFKEFGSSGDGFWIHSQFLRAERNVASGFTGHGFVHWQSDEDLVDFKTDYLPSEFAQEPELEDDATAWLYHASTRMKGNVMYGGRTGLFATFSQSGGPKNYMTDLLVYGVKTGVRQKYFHDMAIYNSVFIGDPEAPTGQAFNTHNKGSSWKFLDCHFEGFERGVSNTGRGGLDAVIGGYCDNINNIYVRKFHSNYHRTLVKGVTFGRTMRPRAMGGLIQSDFKGIAAMGHAGTSWNDATLTYCYFIDAGQVYKGYLEYHQDPDAKPFSGGDFASNYPVPESVQQMTNTELDPDHYATEYLPATAIQLPQYTYDNLKHEPVASLPSVYDSMGVYVVHPLPNLVLPTTETQSVIDLGKVFYEPLDETLSYEVYFNDNPSLVGTSISGSTLTLTYNGSSGGEAIIRVRATAPVRNESSSDAFKVELLSTFPELPPQGADDGFAVDQDIMLNVAAPGVLGNDIERNGDAMTVRLKERTNHGTLSLQADGSFTYTPDPAFSGTDGFIYQPHDGKSNGEPVHVEITVNDTGNDAPVAIDDAPSYYEGIETLTLDISEPTDGLLWNDYDPEGDAISVASFDSTSANGGAVSVNGDGSFSYTPNGAFTGADSFTYTITDGMATSPPATVHIFVKKVFSAPRPFFLENWITRSFSNADTPPNPNNWTRGSNMNTSFVSSAAAEEGDADNMCLQVSRGNKSEDTESLSVSIDASNYNEISVSYERRFYQVFSNRGYYLRSYWSDDGGSTWEELETISETETFLVGGDPLVNGQPYQVTPGGVGVDYSGIGGPDAANALQGTVFVPLDGSAVPVGGELNESPTPEDEDGFIDWETSSFDLPVEANANPNLMLRFYYKSALNPPKFWLDNVKVSGVPIANTAPDASDDSYSVDEDTTLTVSDPFQGVLANDHDAENDFRLVEVLTLPSRGQLVMNDDGTFSYTPDDHFTGVDTFTYRNTDLREASPPATVTITVNSIEDEPVTVDDDAVTDEDQTVVIPALENDEDNDGDIISIVSVGTPSFGTAVLNTADNTISYTPKPGYDGFDSFTYTISDGKTPVTGTVSVTVIDTHDSPPVAEAGPDQALIDTDGLNGETVTLDGSGSYNDNGIVSYVWEEGGVQIGTGVVLSLSLDDGTHAITLTVTDDGGASATDTVTVTVGATPGFNNVLLVTDDGATDPMVSFLRENFSNIGTILTGRHRSGAPAVDSSYTVIVSRNTSSGSYDDSVAEIDSWNSLTNSMLVMNPYAARSSIWGWLGGSEAATKSTSGTETHVSSASDPLFDRVSISSDLADLYDIGGSGGSLTTSIDSSDVGGGTLLGDIGGGTVLARWAAGDAMADTTPSDLSVAQTTHAGPRIMYALSTGGFTSDLSGDGTRVLLNALLDLGMTAPPPSAVAGSDQTIADSDGIDGEEVTLDGSGSSDMNGTISGYVWSENGTEIATGVNPTVVLGDGVHTITLTVLDNDGEMGAGTVTITVLAPVDTDGDGIPDSFEDANGLNKADGSDAALDSDGNGQTNLEEFTAGTDPQDANSRFATSFVGNVTDTIIPIEWDSARGREYTIQKSTDLKTWTGVASGVIATPPRNSYDVPINDPERIFVRVGVVIP